MEELTRRFEFVIDPTGRFQVEKGRRRFDYHNTSPGDASYEFVEQELGIRPENPNFGFVAMEIAAGVIRQLGNSASSADAKTTVCASTSASPWKGVKRAMLWNGVSRMPRFNAHRCMNASSS